MTQEDRVRHALGVSDALFKQVSEITPSMLGTIEVNIICALAHTSKALRCAMQANARTDCLLLALESLSGALRNRLNGGHGERETERDTTGM